MNTLLTKETKVLIQGITGREGSRACTYMLEYGTQVIAGVSPGKGGQRVENIPVFATVKEALTAYPSINATLVAVPAAFVQAAVLDAIEAGIALINILAEHVPTRVTALLIREANRAGVRIVGPSSVGIMVPGAVKIGSIGSGSTARVFTPGSVAVISKSGGMTAEISSVLTNAGIGQSFVAGIGGDRLIGSDFVDMLNVVRNDEHTRVIVLFGEVGGSYEELAAEYIRQTKFPKPVIAIVAGEFTQTLPQGTVLGHAGALVMRGRGSYASKISAFKSAGVTLVSELEEIPRIIKNYL